MFVSNIIVPKTARMSNLLTFYLEEIKKKENKAHFKLVLYFLSFLFLLSKFKYFKITEFSFLGGVSL